MPYERLMLERFGCVRSSTAGSQSNTTPLCGANSSSVVLTVSSPDRLVTKKSCSELL